MAFKNGILFPIKLSSDFNLKNDPEISFFSLYIRRKAIIQNKIVAHYQNGKMFKGSTNDFFPTKDPFHFVPSNTLPESKPLKLLTTDLKGLFFIKDFGGNPDYNEKKEFDPTKQLFGRKIKVVFKDGELILGTTNGYQKDRPGFFVVPADPNSDNERCFVVAAATREVSLI